MKLSKVVKKVSKLYKKCTGTKVKVSINVGLDIVEERPLMIDVKKNSIEVSIPHYYKVTDVEELTALAKKIANEHPKYSNTAVSYRIAIDALHMIKVSKFLKYESAEADVIEQAIKNFNDRMKSIVIDA